MNKHGRDEKCVPDIVGKLMGRDKFEYPDEDERIILKCVLNKQGDTVDLIHLSWVWTDDGFCEYGKKVS
jgi:hypothetical protein